MRSCRRHSLGFPFERWPTRDRVAWSAAIRDGDLFEESGQAAQWRPATKACVQRHYGYWLRFLVDSGLLDEAVAPADRVDRERVVRYVESHRAFCTDTTVAGYLNGLRLALCAIAPERDWSWVARAVRRLRRRRSNPAKKRARMRPVREIWDLGVALMTKAETEVAEGPEVRAILYRDGLLIALLAARPKLRMKNLCEIEIGQHLVHSGEVYWLVFGPDETKTRAPIEEPVPTELVSWLDTYLEKHRLALLQGGTTNRLWVSRLGTPLRPFSIYDRIVKRTNRAFGAPINPHLVRDCAVTSTVIKDPKHARIASAIVGHADPRTTEKYYNQAQMIEASRAHAATMRALRR